MSLAQCVLYSVNVHVHVYACSKVLLCIILLPADNSILVNVGLHAMVKSGQYNIVIATGDEVSFKLQENTLIIL